MTIIEKIKNLFHKPLELPVFINTWNHRVIARRGSYFTPELMQQAARMGKRFKLNKVALSTTFIMEDIQKILTKEIKNYGFITENLKFLDDITGYIGKVQVPEQIISELQWMKDNFSYNYHHLIAVATLATRISRDFFLDEKEILETAEIAMLYDIGIGHVQANVVQKVGALSIEERNIINYHPIYSALLISHYYQDEHYHLIEPVINHHENLDGTGFPRKIKNKNIHSHILKLADTFDALISARPFRRFFAPKEAFKICEDQINSGKFIPEILPIIYSYYLFIDQYPT
jgi:HD-GYP domain-containing protein (c-di-GMP phosphodiesterase class II)